MNEYLRSLSDSLSYLAHWEMLVATNRYKKKEIMSISNIKWCSKYKSTKAQKEPQYV